ncbi:kelch repeat and BTB domain-containing protein 12 isoform X2 [Bombina bombina]|uniref:kelch repeat and BTB domain-containing protein 12 isoform X2 n=1 Tax=Bombina bombina TaxID=8345 RepID=UPI00235ADF1F|nr:kelch repeat and BTB domain-containing protein 12 isoform X2 [Bombina bombina]
MEGSSEQIKKQKHGASLLESVCRMREAAELIDIVLLAEGQRFPCHRVVLASFSPYFRAMFTCGLVECNQTEVALHDITAESVSIILDFLYNAQLTITNSTVQGIATAAYFMQMEEIFCMCQRYMMDHMDVSNCLGIYYFAKQISAEELSEKSKKYLYQHFTEVSLHDEILEVELDQLVGMIRSDDLNVSREESILDLVLRWVNYDRNARAQNLTELLKQVRLLLVNPTYLREARKRNTVLLFNSQCYDLIEEALETIEKSKQISPSLRYGMETTNLLLCIGNNSMGIRSKYGSYGDASFCFAPVTGKTCFIPSPKQGELLGAVSAGVVSENNEIILAGEATAVRLSRQKAQKVEICRYHDRGTRCWEQLCNAEYRELYALGTIRNDLYLIGGQMKLKNQYVVTNCVDRYSMESGTWRSVAPLPIQLACHAVVTLNNKLFVIGGWTPQTDHPDDEPDRLSNRLIQYDPVQDKWIQLAPMQYSKYRFSAAVVNSEIYVLDRHEVIIKEILELDPWENQWNVVYMRAPMHDTYDVCLVAKLNPRDLIPPPRDLEQR